MTYTVEMATSEASAAAVALEGDADDDADPPPAKALDQERLKPAAVVLVMTGKLAS